MRSRGQSEQQQILRKRASVGSARYQQAVSKIHVFRTDAGQEHNLNEIKQPSSTNTFLLQHSPTESPTLSSITASPPNSFHYQNRHSFSEEDKQKGVRIYDDDDRETLYSHASIIDIQDVIDMDDLLFLTDNLHPRRSSFKRSFQRANQSKDKIQKQQQTKQTKQTKQLRNMQQEEQTHNQQQMVVRSSVSLYDKILKGLNILFNQDEFAKINTLKYITDLSSGGSVLSSTEREVISKLLQATYMVGGESDKSHFDQSLTPWRSSSFQHDYTLRVTDVLLTSLIVGTSRNSYKQISHSFNSDSLSIDLGFAGAFLLIIIILSKLKCKIIKRKSNSFFKVYCNEHKFYFSFSLNGNDPCKLKFQRPGILSICKIDHYVSLVTRLRDLTHEFVTFVHS